MPRTHVNYTSDDTLVYRMAQDSANAAAAGNPAATSALHLPGSYHPRYILATHPTNGIERRIEISDPTNPLFVGGTSTITLVDTSVFPSVHTAFAVNSRVGEKRYNR